MSKEEYMHETLKADAVCYDLPNEEIIQQLANENEELQSENKALLKRAEALKEYVRHKDNCAYIQGLKGNSIEDCDCGLQALKGGK